MFCEDTKRIKEGAVVVKCIDWLDFGPEILIIWYCDGGAIFRKRELTGSGPQREADQNENGGQRTRSMRVKIE